MVWVETRPQNLTTFYEFAQEFAVQLNSALKEKNSKVNPVACNLWNPDRNLQVDFFNVKLSRFKTFYIPHKVT